MGSSKNTYVKIYVLRIANLTYNAKSARKLNLVHLIRLEEPEFLPNLI